LAERFLFSDSGGRSVLAKEARQLNVQQSPGITPDVENLKGRFNPRK